MMMNIIRMIMVIIMIIITMLIIRMVIITIIITMMMIIIIIMIIIFQMITANNIHFTLASVIFLLVHSFGITKLLPTGFYMTDKEKQLMSNNE